MSQPPNSRQTSLLDTRLLHLTTLRAHPKTLCPSEVARSFTTPELHQLSMDPSLSPSLPSTSTVTSTILSWRDLMPHIRTLCFTLRDAGEIEILQRGEVVRGDEGDVRGPIRIRLRREGEGAPGGESGGGGVESGRREDEDGWEG